jgi:CheY-like chemotaxis protein
MRAYGLFCMKNEDEAAPLAVVVEDEPLVGLVTASFLEDAGYEVMAVSSAEDALVIFKHGNTAQLLVTDVEMPGMSGLALLEAVREVQPTLVAVVTSGRQMVSRSELGPGARFLPKPFTSDQLMAEVMAATRTFDARRKRSARG